MKLCLVIVPPPLSGGHKDKTQWCTIEACLFICISHEQVWSGCITKSPGTDRCLSLYSGLTQCQGHTVWHPLLFAFFLAKFWLSLFRNYYWFIKGFAFYIQYTMKSLQKTRWPYCTMRPLATECAISTLSPLKVTMYIIYSAAAGLFDPPSESCH